MDWAATRASDERTHEETAKPKGHDDHDGHDQHEGQEEHGEEQVVRLTEAQLREMGIERQVSHRNGMGGDSRPRVHALALSQRLLACDRRVAL